MTKRRSERRSDSRISERRAEKEAEKGAERSTKKMWMRELLRRVRGKWSEELRAYCAAVACKSNIHVLVLHVQSEGARHRKQRILELPRNPNEK
jgi:hypothetical protein